MRPFSQLFSQLIAATILGAATLLVQAQGSAESRQPRVVDIKPAQSELIPDGAVFALKLAKPMGNAKAQAMCDVWGIRSSVPTEMIPSPRRENVLRAYSVDASDPHWVVLRCQTTLPDGARVTLRWLNPERAIERDESDGWDGQRYSYNVRSEWPVSVVCTRSNAGEGCNPLEKVALQFTQRMADNVVGTVSLVDEQGKTYKPVTEREKNTNQWWGIGAEIAFDKLPANKTLTVRWSNDFGKGKKPITVRMGGYPPLLKFGANFGIAERAIGGVVPLTVRSIDGAPESTRAKLRTLRLNDEASIIETIQTLMQTVSRDDDSYYGGEGWEDECCEGNSSTQPSTKKRLRYPIKLSDTKGGERRGENDSRKVSWLKPFKETKTQDLPIKLESGAFEVLGVPLTESGFYLLEGESLNLGRALMDNNQAMYVRSGALVTDLGVHLHLGLDTAVVWVSSLSTGQAVGGAEVTLYDCNAKRLGGGAANAQGWVQLDGKFNRPWNCPVFAFAKKDGDLGFVQSNWQRGIQSWRFETLKNSYASTSKRLLHTVLARNLLRGGEVLHGKVFWRSLNTKGDWVYPRTADLPKTIDLIHSGSEEKTSVPITWSARANGEFSYKIPEGAKRGVYRISIGSADRNRWGEESVDGTVFRVEDFRLPTLKAEVLPPATQQVQASQVPVQLRLSFLSGGAAGAEKISVAHRLLDYTPRFSDYDDFFFLSDDRYRGWWRSAEEDEAATRMNEQKLGEDDTQITLNAAGQTTVNVKVPSKLTAPKTLLTEMEYQDPNGETYRAQGRTTLWPSSVVLGVKLPYWSSGKAQSAEFVTLGVNGKPAPNVVVSVEGGFRGYVTHRTKTVGGYYSYKWERIEQPFKPLCSGKSDAAGRFTCRFSPDMSDYDSGEFALSAKALDSAGRASVLGTSLYLYGGGEVWFSQSDHDRMDIVAEKTKYKAGDTASIQVRSPFRTATAWINVMRAGAVIDTLVVPLSGTNPSIALPIKPSYAPNVFVNVLAVRGRVGEPAATALVDLGRPSFKLGITHLDVTGDAHELKVKVQTDKAVYQSREKAKVSIQVNKAGSGVMPLGGEVTVFAIDEALLELLPNNTWDVLKTMLQQKGYGFETASAAMQVIGKRHYGRKAMPPGGGGGKSPTRELFDTLLAWHGTVKLDALGGASVEIPVNDSLTRFRVVAVANAGTDLFGTGMSSFTSTKDLQILSGLPATVREGDTYSANVTLRNTTETAMQVLVRALQSGKELGSQRVALPAKSTKQVTWRTAAPANLDDVRGEQTWRFEASGDLRGVDGAMVTRTDALQIKQAVTPSLMPLRYEFGGQTLKSGSPLALDPTSALKALSGADTSPVPNKGEMRISLSPALATDAAGVRNYMQSYPFYCLEQRTSKAVSLKDKALWDIIYNTLDQYVSESGLVNYYPSQGAYGYGDGYDVLTSFVLSAAHEAGFKLPESAKAKMLQGLAHFVQGKLERRFEYYSNDRYALTERKLLALEALMRHQTATTKVPLNWTESLRLTKDDLTQLSNRALTQWLDVIHRSDWANKEALSKLALEALQARLVNYNGALRLKQDPRDNYWYYMYSNATSQVRLALLSLDHPALKAQSDGLAIGAMQMQKSGAWWETQSNVWGALMLDKRAAQKAGGMSGVTRIALGDKRFEHDWGKVPMGEAYSFSAAQWLAAKSSPIEVLHAGGGEPYVVALGTAWSALGKSKESGAFVGRSVKPIKQAVKGAWSVGDIAEVTVNFSLKQNMGWLALTDPIPPGSTVLGSGLGGQTAVDAKLQTSWYGRPAYVERTFTHIRAYYEYIYGGAQSLTYQIRINNAGKFALPPTQLEAMYDPSVYAYVPNDVVEVR